MYKIYYIKKKNGKFRKICAPDEELKTKQKACNNDLTESLKLHKTALGFIRHKSIIDNAKIHMNTEAILNIDLKDFFDSIDSSMVKLALERNSLQEDSLSEILALGIIEEFDNLPQGSPMSPFLANLYCKPMDKKLFTLAKHHKIKYSRYADDLTFSGKKEDLINIKQDIFKIIKSYNLNINYKKVKLLYGNRKEVTGLNISDKLSYGRKEYNKLRADIYRLNKHLNDGFRGDYKEVLGNTINYVIGRACFISYVNPTLKRIKYSSIALFKRLSSLNLL